MCETVYDRKRILLGTGQDDSGWYVVTSADGARSARVSIAGNGGYIQLPWDETIYWARPMADGDPAVLGLYPTSSGDRRRGARFMRGATLRRFPKRPPILIPVGPHEFVVRTEVAFDRCHLGNLKEIERTRSSVLMEAFTAGEASVAA